MCVCELCDMCGFCCLACGCVRWLRVRFLVACGCCAVLQSSISHRSRRQKQGTECLIIVMQGWTNRRAQRRLRIPAQAVGQEPCELRVAIRYMRRH